MEKVWAAHVRTEARCVVWCSRDRQLRVIASEPPVRAWLLWLRSGQFAAAAFCALAGALSLRSAPVPLRINIISRSLPTLRITGAG
jgi:hypothetical protein